MGADVDRSSYCRVRPRRRPQLQSGGGRAHGRRRLIMSQGIASKTHLQVENYYDSTSFLLPLLLYYLLFIAASAAT